MSRVFACFILIASILASGFWLATAELHNTVSADDQRQPSNQGGDLAADVAEPAAKADDGLKLLGKTYKLTFKLVPDEEEPALVIRAAKPEYEVSINVSEANYDYENQISGELQPLSGSKRMLLTFDTLLHYIDQQDGTEATFTAKGSAVVEVGQVRTIAELGEKSLTVIIKEDVIERAD